MAKISPGLPLRESSFKGANSGNPGSANSLRRSVKNITASSVSAEMKADSLEKLFAASAAAMGNAALASLLFSIAGVDGHDPSGWDSYSPSQMRPFIKTMAEAIAGYEPGDFPDGALDDEEEAAVEEVSPDDLGSYASDDADWDAHYSKDAVKAARARRKAELTGLPVDMFEEVRELESVEAMEEYLAEPALKNAARRIGSMFTPGKDFPEEEASVEKELTAAGATVAVRLRYTQGDQCGDTYFWCSNETDPIEAYKQLVVLRKARGTSSAGKAIMTVTGVWFTDLCAGVWDFQYRFLNTRIVPVDQNVLNPKTKKPYLDQSTDYYDKVLKDVFVKPDGTAKPNQTVMESFSNSGTMLRMCAYDRKIMGLLPSCKTLVNLLFGKRFDFDLGDDYLKPVNWMFSDSLEALDRLVRIVVDPGHPDYRTDERFNMIRKSPVDLSASLTEKYIRCMDQHSYLESRNDLMSEFDGVDNVLWFCPSTMSTDNAGMRLGPSDRKVKGHGTQAGRFVVPDGVKAINPYCFGKRNTSIRELVLPESMEFMPPLLYYTLPNLEKVEGVPSPGALVQPMSYAGYRASKGIVVPPGVKSVGYGAFSDTSASEITFENPDDVVSLGDCAFMPGAINPMEGDGCKYSLPYRKKDYKPDLFMSVPGKQTGMMFNKLFTRKTNYNNNRVFYFPEPDEAYGADGNKIKIPPSCRDFDLRELKKLGRRCSNYFMGWEASVSVADPLEYANNAVRRTNILSSKFLKVIGDLAFWGNRSMEFDGSGTLAIPESVEYIGDGAFGDSLHKVERLVLPAGIDPDSVGTMSFCLSRMLMSIMYIPIHRTSSFSDADLDFAGRLTSSFPRDYRDNVAATFKKCFRLKEISLPGFFKDDDVKFFNTFGFTPRTVGDTFGVKLIYI